MRTEDGIDATLWAAAERDVAQRLYGHGTIAPREVQSIEPHIGVTVDIMLDQPAVYGFDGDGIDSDDLANAIITATKGDAWEYYHFDHPEKLPDDRAHSFILKGARKAVTAILESASGHGYIERRYDDFMEDASYEAYME